MNRRYLFKTLAAAVVGVPAVVAVAKPISEPVVMKGIRFDPDELSFESFKMEVLSGPRWTFGDVVVKPLDERGVSVVEYMERFSK